MSKHNKYCNESSRSPTSPGSWNDEDGALSSVSVFYQFALPLVIICYIYFRLTKVIMIHIIRPIIPKSMVSYVLVLPQQTIQMAQIPIIIRLQLAERLEIFKAVLQIHRVQKVIWKMKQNQYQVLNQLVRTVRRGKNAFFF